MQPRSPTLGGQGAEKLFGPKGVETIESCIKLHTEEVHNL